MRCVSYKQICYQAVNTKVMGLLMLISVFISLYYKGNFFPYTAADLGHSFASCTVQRSCCFLQGLCRDGHISPHTSHLQPTAAAEQLSPHGCHHAGMPIRMEKVKESPHGLAQVPVHSLELGPPILADWRGKARSHQGREKARTLREDSPFPQVLLNGEEAATSV